MTQYPMNDVEEIGLIKFDFLGLKTLTLLADAVTLIRATRPESELDLAKLPLDDAKTYKLLAKGDTVGVFQMEVGRHAEADHAAPPEPLRRPRRRARALPARPARQRHGRGVHQAQARQGKDRLPAPAARDDPARDLRHHRLPGAGHADRPDARRLLARRRRQPPPRHGQEEDGGDGQGARALPRRAPSGRASRPSSRRASSTRWRPSRPTASTSPTPPPTR